MDEKELQEYKQKLKGLSLKDLNDILSHINKDKVPEKYSAVEVEIASRTGAPAPKIQPAKPKEEEVHPAAATPKSEQAPEVPVSADSPKPPTVQLRKSKVSFTQAPEEKARPAAPATPPPPSVSAPVLPKAKPAEVSAKKPLDLVLTAVSVLFAIAGIYFLLVPFVPVPGAPAIKAFLIKIPPHF